jgi:hypothetical protein
MDLIQKIVKKIVSKVLQSKLTKLLEGKKSYIVLGSGLLLIADQFLGTQLAGEIDLDSNGEKNAALVAAGLVNLALFTMKLAQQRHFGKLKKMIQNGGATVLLVAIFPLVGCVYVHAQASVPTAPSLSTTISADDAEDIAKESKWDCEIRSFGVAVSNIDFKCPADKDEQPGTVTAGSLGFSKVFGTMWEAGTGMLTTLANAALQLLGRPLLGGGS